MAAILRPWHPHVAQLARLLLYDKKDKLRVAFSELSHKFCMRMEAQSQFIDTQFLDYTLWLV